MMLFCCFLGLSVVLIILVLWLVCDCIYRRPSIPDLESRFILITGCDSGFGLNAALKFDSMGVNVFAACLTQDGVERLRTSCSDKLVAKQMDVTKEEDIKAMYDVVVKSLPDGEGLWALINNAGLMGPIGLFDMLQRKHYQQTMDVNLFGLISVTKQFLPLIVQAKGRVVNTASTVGRLAFGAGPYTLSKFCVEGFTDRLRVELRGSGVSVHTIEPGGYQTSITDAGVANSQLDKVYAGLTETQKHFYGERYKTKIEDMTRLACFLLSSRSLGQVVNCYTHAVTSKRPRTRYVVGSNAHLFFRPMWTVPTCLSDFIIGMQYPLPEAIYKLL